MAQDKIRNFFVVFEARKVPVDEASADVTIDELISATVSVSSSVAILLKMSLISGPKQLPLVRKRLWQSMVTQFILTVYTIKGETEKLLSTLYLEEFPSAKPLIKLIDRKA